MNRILVQRQIIPERHRFQLPPAVAVPVLLGLLVAVIELAKASA